MSKRATFFIVLILMLIFWCHQVDAGPSPSSSKKNNKDHGGTAGGGSSNTTPSTTLLVKAYTSSGYKGHSEHFALANGNCVNLVHTPKLNNKIKSIKIKYNDSKVATGSSSVKCAMFFNTSNCKTGGAEIAMVHVEDVGTEASDLKKWNMSESISSMKACPDNGLSAAQIRNPGIPAILKMNFTNATFPGTSKTTLSNYSSLLEVKPDHCSPFPFPNATRYTIQLQINDKNSKKEEEASTTCVEVYYTSMNCIGTSSRLTKDRSYLQTPGNSSILSTSLCNFKIRRELNMFPTKIAITPRQPIAVTQSTTTTTTTPRPVPAKKPVPVDQGAPIIIIQAQTSTAATTTTPSTTTAPTTSLPVPVHHMIPIPNNTGLLLRAIPENATFVIITKKASNISTATANVTTTTKKTTTTTTTTAAPAMVEIRYIVFTQEIPVISGNISNATQSKAQNITKNATTTTKAPTTTLPRRQKSPSKKNATTTTTIIKFNTPRPGDSYILIHVPTNPGSAKSDAASIRNWLNKNPFVGAALCFAFFTISFKFCCGCCQLRQNPVNSYTFIA